MQGNDSICGGHSQRQPGKNLTISLAKFGIQSFPEIGRVEAELEVKVALQSDGEVKVALLKDDSWLVMTPCKTTPTTGLILYPEGHMDIHSYALISREIARQGFHIVFLSRRLETEYSEAEEQQRIQAVMATYPQIERWVVGGHTWGGRVGAGYAANYPDRVAGVVLWAGRMDETTSLADSDLPVLVVYGTLDDENVNLVASNKPFLPEHTVWVAIEGGEPGAVRQFRADACGCSRDHQ